LSYWPTRQGIDSWALEIRALNALPDANSPGLSILFYFFTSTLEVARRAPPGRAGCRVALRRNGDIGSGRSAARLVISSIEESRFAYA